MKHLSATEFVDLIESPATLAPERVRHAQTCAECVARAEALRDVRAAALEDEETQPSPLFWDHFAARVSAAVRNEPTPAPHISWFRRPAITWGTAVSMTVLLAALAVWRATLHAPAPVVSLTRQASTSDVVLPVSEVAVADDVDADEAWAVVRAATIDLNWDDVHAAGISAHPDDVENVVLALTADERHELARLLDADLKRKGA